MYQLRPHQVTYWSIFVLWVFSLSPPFLVFSTKKRGREDNCEVSRYKIFFLRRNLRLTKQKQKKVKEGKI